MSFGLLGSVLVAIGGTLLARLPRNAGWAWLVQLRASIPAFPLGLTLAIIGVVVLTIAWWGLLREVANTGRAGGSYVFRCAAVWAAPMLFTPPLFSGDGWSYVATGYMTKLGLTPYLYTPALLTTPLRSGVSPKWMDTPSPYGPFSLAWGELFANVTANPYVLLLAYRLLTVLGLVLIGWAVVRLARRVGADPARAAALAVASPFMLLIAVAGVHNDVAVAGVAAVGVVFAARRQWVLGALIVGSAAAIKAPGGIAAIAVILVSLPAAASIGDRLRRTAAVGAISGAVLVGSGLLTGLGMGWLSALSQTQGATQQRNPMTAVKLVVSEIYGSLPAAWTELLTVSSIMRAVSVLALMGIGLWALFGRRFDTGRLDHAMMATAVVMVVAVLTSLAVQWWYFAWAVPFLAAQPWQALRESSTKAQQAALLAAVVVLGLATLNDGAFGLRHVTTLTLVAVYVLPVLVWATVAMQRSASPTGPHSDSKSGVPTAEPETVGSAAAVDR